MELKWQDCKGDVWCTLLGVNLDHKHFEDMDGVYIVWYFDQDKPITVRLGQGVIKDRIAEHREDPAVLAYKQNMLYVTWARVSTKYQGGVERYLAEKLNPKVGIRFPEVEPIQVNLPPW